MFAALCEWEGCAAVLCCMIRSSSATLSWVSQHGEEEGWIDGLTTCLVPFLPLLVNMSLLKGLACLAVLYTFLSICRSLIVIVQ